MFYRNIVLSQNGQKSKKSKRPALESDSHDNMSTDISDIDQPVTSQGCTSLKSKILLLPLLFFAVFANTVVVACLARCRPGDLLSTDV